VTTLRERDGGLIEQWYIACLSRELRRDAPVARTIYDTPLVLFRDANGRAVCVPDACLHRFAPLSKGAVRDGCLVCPYHGWTYDGDGRVVAIPSEGEERSRAFRLPPLPVTEHDDCVWVWLGSEAPTSAAPPPFRFPHHRARGWVTYFMRTDFANEVTHLVENFMDVPHTAHVHRGWFRKPSQKRVPIRVESTDRDVLVTYDQSADAIGFTARILNPRNEPVRHTDHFFMPNVTRVDYEFGSEKTFIITSQCTPVSAFATRVYTHIAYRLPLGRMLTPFFRFYTRRVIEQDVAIMQQQGDNLRREPRPRFHHTAADVIHVAIEQLRDAAARGEPPPKPRVVESVIWV
jgi:phenylpropionate dioxygenase-like ring-hydroxylating dioxygenase large terminal subunit